VRAEGSLNRAGGLAILLAVAFLAASAQALAAGRPPAPPPPTSAIDQYIESVPTAGGGVVNGVGKTRSKALPKRVGAAIERQGGADAATLRAIASTSTYGAPQKRIAPKQVAHPRREPPESSGALSAAAIATGSSGSHALWLLGILVVTTVAAFVAAGLRQRAQR
jgi:hypothetical protein